MKPGALVVQVAQDAGRYHLDDCESTDLLLFKVRVQVPKYRVYSQIIVTISQQRNHVYTNTYYIYIYTHHIWVLWTLWDVIPAEIIIGVIT